MQLPDDKWGRFVCIIAGLFFGVGSSWLLIELAIKVGFRVDRIWVFEFLAMFATFGWGLFLWGVAMPAWITRIVHHATGYIILAIMVLFLPIAFEFLLLCFQGRI